MRKVNFRGKISVRHTADAFAVRFEAGTMTDAHDLGHALAAIMTKFQSQARRAGCPQELLDSMYDDIIRGIRCGLEHNPVPLNERH